MDFLTQSQTISNFEDLGLSPETLSSLESRGITIPTPIQSLTIPAILQTPNDIVGQAKTGTGKTIAFLAPILDMLDEEDRSLECIILSPTRELSTQISEEFKTLKADRDLSMALILGGKSYENQFRDLKNSPSIVVGTPGRIIDHIDKGTLDLSNIKFLVLDEADEMLDMGFLEDIETIIENTPEEKRTILFSATLNKRILGIAEKFLNKPSFFKASEEKETSTIVQHYYRVDRSSSAQSLYRILDFEPNFYGIIFARTKSDVDEISRNLIDRNFKAKGIHGDFSQKDRERTLSQFRSGQTKILVATDVAARGIDVPGLTHVINFQLPDDFDTYKHRIGRTGRAGNTGIAISLVERKDQYKLERFNKVLGNQILSQKLPSTEQILEVKRNSLLEKIQEKISNEPGAEYSDLAKAVLESSEPQKALAGVIQYFLPKYFDVSKYGGEVSEDSFSKRDSGDGGRKKRSNASSSREGFRDRGDGDKPRKFGSRDRDGGKFGDRDRRDGDKSRKFGSRDGGKFAKRDGGDRKPFVKKESFSGRDDDRPKFRSDDDKPRFSGDGDKKPFRVKTEFSKSRDRDFERSDSAKSSPKEEKLSFRERLFGKKEERPEKSGEREERSPFRRDKEKTSDNFRKKEFGKRSEKKEFRKSNASSFKAKGKKSFSSKKETPESKKRFRSKDR